MNILPDIIWTRLNCDFGCNLYVKPLFSALSFEFICLIIDRNTFGLLSFIDSTLFSSILLNVTRWYETGRLIVTI